MLEAAKTARASALFFGRGEGEPFDDAVRLMGVQRAIVVLAETTPVMSLSAGERPQGVGFFCACLRFCLTPLEKTRLPEVQEQGRSMAEEGNRLVPGSPVLLCPSAFAVYCPKQHKER